MIKEAQLGWAQPATGGAHARAQSRRSQRQGRRGLPMEFFGVLYFCLVVLAGGALVWQPAKVAQVNERIGSLEADLKALRLQSESLKQQVSEAESLDYIEEEARTRLGMVSPSEVRTFALTEEGSGVTQVASTGDDAEEGGILSLFSRIAQIFGATEATAAKGQR